MNVIHPIGVLMSIKNIFYDKIDLRLFLMFVKKDDSTRN